MKAEQATDPVAMHGEGPVWWPDGELRWVDMLAGDVLSLAVDGRVLRDHVGTVAAAVRPRSSGGEVIALERGFALREPGQTTPIVLPSLFQDVDVRMNEGSCAPDGSFWCGSMAYDARPGRGALYRLAADRSVTIQLADVTISNGIDWSPDGSTVYYVDTPTKRIDAFDWAPDTGLTNRREFVSIVGGDPDGLVVDAEAGVWVALWGEGCVQRFDYRGRLDVIVEVPTRQVTACTLGGGYLHITTSRLGVSAEDDPLAGAVFRAAVTVEAQPTRCFIG